MVLRGRKESQGFREGQWDWVGDTGFEPVSKPSCVTVSDLRIQAADLRQHETVARNLPEHNGIE